MNLLNPRRAAIVRRYAAMITDHNGNSDGYAQVVLGLFTVRICAVKLTLFFAVDVKANLTSI